jgi:hypothetical protein
LRYIRFLVHQFKKETSLMADESLELRQAEMRSRMKTQVRRQIVKQVVDIQEVVPNESGKLPDEPASPISNFGIVKRRSGSTITRKQLYNLVWTEPMIRAAKRFQVSDVAVAKAWRI